MLTQFKIRVLLHIGFLVLLVIASLSLLAYENLIPFAVVLVFLLVLTIISLFRLVNRTNRHLANFLMSIKYDDFELTYSSQTWENSEKDLFGAFNMINGKFRNIRLEKEMQLQYYEALVEQVRTGLIGFDDSGATIFMNSALKTLLHKSYFPSFESVGRFDPDLHEKLLKLLPGQSTMYKRQFGNETIQVAIQTTQIKLKGGTFSFFSFQNIHAELQEQELNSWKKLIRILTHEIMNSVSPVVSLANATNDLLEREGEILPEVRSELHSAIQAIQKRSEGLMHFTQAYRRLTKLPEPRISEIDAVALVDRVVVLMRSSMQVQGIALEKSYGSGPVWFGGDPELLEQAFINLFKNAIEALTGQKNAVIRVGINQAGNAVAFRIADNGPGIPQDIIDQIFAPFFTTKKEGSGIGLSVTRQIVQMHGGTLSVYCPPGEGTEFAVVI